jgi:hypothetical protein
MFLPISVLFNGCMANVYFYKFPGVVSREEVAALGDHPGADGVDCIYSSCCEELQDEYMAGTTHMTIQRGALKANPEAPGWTKRFHHKVFASHI